MNVLGINAVFHELSAALIVDGKVVAACEEERFNRVKHGKPAQIDNPHELPEQAIRFCLESCRAEDFRYRPGGVLVRSSASPRGISARIGGLTARWRRSSWSASARSATLPTGSWAGSSAGPSSSCPITSRMPLRPTIPPASIRPRSSSSTASARPPVRRSRGARARGSKPSRHFRIRIPWDLSGSTPAFISASRLTMPPRSWASPPTAIPRSIGDNWRRSSEVSEDGYQVDLAALGFPSFDPKGFRALARAEAEAGRGDSPSTHAFCRGAAGRHRCGRAGSAAASRALRQSPSVCALPEASRSIASPMI